METKLECHRCLKWFRNATTYQKHLELHNSILEQPSCKVCSLDFLNENDYMSHIQRY
jgi:uncharacterized C2H2 Zn-finger protein